MTARNGRPAAPGTHAELAAQLFAQLADVQPCLREPLMAYLALFAPGKQQLGWGHALRLAREVLAMQQAGAEQLAAALATAAAELGRQRPAPGRQALRDHQHLRRLLRPASGLPGPLPGSSQAPGA